MTISTSLSPTVEDLHIRTFRASSMPEALQEIRRTLGPDAAVLQTREVRRGLFQWLTGARQIEVVASSEIQVPSRFPQWAAAAPEPGAGAPLQPRLSGRGEADEATDLPPAHATDYRRQLRESLKQEPGTPHSWVEDLSCEAARPRRHDLPEILQPVYRELLQAEVEEELAWELVDQVRQAASPRDLLDPVLLKARVARLIERELRVSGPLQVRPAQTRIVALVGPTGVGKTTTVAKLAAYYRLREQRRVGLITTDTYRLAAVEQLRSYADILEVPLEVVSTPREVRAAVERLSGLELILVDTAGRSPQDAMKIQELKSTLAEAQADEVQLVLSVVASAAYLRNTAAQFAPAGVTALLLTKLDEATTLGQLLALARSTRWPLSYVTTGQNVPEDIEPADHRKLTRLLLGVKAC
ncbi:MAG: flagellar biosynthesis protein FlhF [Planctomycetota bacterium]|nr:flagellar biosynthesis protein FlhF [Planctomycetota bacterium]